MGIVKFNQFLTYFLHENSRNMGWLSRGYNLFSNEYRNQRIYQDKNPDIMLEFFFNTASDKNAENSLIYNQTYIDKLASDFIKMQVDYNIIPPSILYSQQNVASMLGNFDILKNPYNDSGNNINNYLIKRKKFLGEFYHIYGSAPINFLDIYYSKTFSKWQNVFENAEMVASSSILVDNYSDIILYKNKYTNDTSVADLFYVSDIKLGYTKGFGIDKKIQCSDILDFSEQAKLFNLFISKHSNAFFLRGSHFYDYASYGI